MIQVRIDTSKFEKAATDLERKQMPYATALTLTRLGQIAKQKEVRAMGRVFDTPVPWTLKSAYATRVTKKDLALEFGFKGVDERKQFNGKGVPAGKYLKTQILGGAKNETRLDKLMRNRRGSYGKTFVGSNQFITPGAKLPKDSYGSMSPGFLQRMLSSVRAQGDDHQNSKKTSGSFFWGRSRGGKGALGLYRRRGSGKRRRLEPMLKATNRRARYRPRYPFYENMSRTVQNNFDYQFKRAMKQALKTARE
jgi:hypothetical protein